MKLFSTSHGKITKCQFQCRTIKINRKIDILPHVINNHWKGDAGICFLVAHSGRQTGLTFKMFSASEGAEAMAGEVKILL